MIDIDFDIVEEQLDLVIPNIYRMFIDAVTSKDLDLEKHGIYHDTDLVIKGNIMLRSNLVGSEPKWKKTYFDFGVGDGCGNYFFLDGTDVDCDVVKLWAHDPSGIENVGSATDFFMSLLAEIEVGFSGPDQYRFQGNGNWD